MNFCFISSDAEIPAYEKFELLTKNKIWPIFRRTNHRPKLKPNSKIVFYIAGTNIFSQNFVGSAKIDKIKIIEDSTAIEESDTINKISKTILKNKELYMIITLKEVLLSRFPVGSSAIIRDGFPINALAIAALCCSPPDT